MAFWSGMFKKEKKKTEGALHKFGEHLVQIYNKVKDVDKSVKGMEEGLKDLSKEYEERTSVLAEELGSKTAKLSDKVSRHDMALENLLDEWEDIRGEEEKKLRRLESALGLLDKERYREQMEGQEKLLRLTYAYQEQLDALRHLVEGDPAWERQLSLMAGKLSQDQRQAQVEFVGRPGERVDLELMDVLNVVDTPQRELEGQVAEGYSQGLIFRGEVWKKARVSVYRYVEEKEQPFPEPEMEQEAEREQEEFLEMANE